MAGQGWGPDPLRRAGVRFEVEELEAGDEDEPELEDVGEDDQDVALLVASNVTNPAKR